MYNHFMVTCLKYIGTIKLQKLTGANIQKMYAELANTHKPSSIHTIHSIIKTALKSAVRWKRIAHNPCDDIDAPTFQHQERPILNEKQCRTLLKAAQGIDIECFLTMALTTGMRRGEMLGLRCADVDMEKRFLSIQRTASYTKLPGAPAGYIETTPKTPSSRRSIRLTNFLVTALKAQKKKQLEIRPQAGQEWANKDLVFCTSIGNHVPVDFLTRRYKKLLHENGLPQIHIHDLRHSASTLLAGMRVSAKVMQEILGHSSIIITQNLYGHVINGMQEDAMDKMDDLFRKVEEINVL